jgi:hypothetical protein
VVAVVEGLPLRAVSLHAGAERRHTRLRGSCQLACSHGTPTFYVAGIEGQSLLEGAPGLALVDEREARTLIEVAQNLSGSHRLTVEEELRQAHVDAHSVLVRERTALDSLADALLKRGRLSGVEAERIIRRRLTRRTGS